MEIILVWLLLAAGVGFLANSRGRNGFGFFLLSAVLSPLLGLIVVLVTANLKEAEEKERQKQSEDEKKERARREEHEMQLESIKVIANAPRVDPRRGSPSEAVGSVADEIRKLAQLRADGLLTDAEFQNQKSMLLGAVVPPTVAPASAPTRSATTVTPIAYGVCPNCRSSIPLSSVECPKCRASFGVDSTWEIERS